MPAPQQQPGMPPGVTIRAMPTEQSAPLPARRSPATPGRATAGSAPAASGGRSSLPVPPLPPEPEDLLQPGPAPQAATTVRPRTSVQPVAESFDGPVNVKPPLADPR